MGIEVLVVLSLGLMASTVGLSVALWASIRQVRRLEGQVRELSSVPGDARLSQSLEDLTERLDQVTEGQEFLERVMTKRPELPVPPQSPVQGVSEPGEPPAPPPESGPRGG